MVYRATATALAILVMTSIHHIYGAEIFDTPYRLHIVYVSIPVALVILGCVALARRTASAAVARAASWLFVILTGLFAIVAVGFYEGGYNHVIPNIQYLLGVEHTLRAGLYEPPDDLVFQLTGVAQFGIALVAASALWRLLSHHA
ncbi:hypothetical protein CXZ10_15085 [Pleomorphomonas diazotrophica]|uniref:Uncharacterized protein n=1 Tax=Pleomorphomonas diazotrophica TaxID=1166257 RepID=A0A2N3LUP4_9HYPH|nr:hypothetical protein CXZ10_15085 [Pleomorphomonas diazotrophica]